MKKETKHEFTNVENLVLNMSGGLLPQDLTKSEVAMLIKKYGKNWFEFLGYTDAKYKRPKCHKSN